MSAQTQQARLNANENRSRPPFAFKLKSNGSQRRLIVYEILSGEQAEARQQRFERVGSDIHIKPIEEAFTQATLDAHGHLWDGWQAIRVASATSQRYTILRNRLLSEVIDVEDLKQEGATFVSEAIGVRVGLATLAVSPLSKRERMRRVVEGIASMADEECYYWHTLSRSPNDLDGAKALRTLFS
jgi:hypothetical protein